MPDITVRVRDLPAMPTPAMCARTGRPTTETVTLKAVRYPDWTWAGIVFGLVGVLLFRMVSGGETVRVQLPHVRGLRFRRRAGFAGMLVLLPVLTVFGLAAVFENAPWVMAVLGASLAAFVWMGVLYTKSCVVLTWAGPDKVQLSNVHPAFVEALRRRPEPAVRPQPVATAPAGWHPDPSGEFVYRWFDGAQWTEHVSNGVTQPA